MGARVEYFFDFMSPFAYLAHHRLRELQGKFGFELVYHPIDLPRMKLAVGNDGPSNRDIPLKINYLMIDLNRWAERYGIGLSVPGSHDSKWANIGAYLARDRGDMPAYVQAIWERTWGGPGGDFASTELLRDVALLMQWDPDEFLTFVNAPDNEKRYLAETDAAVAAGVFGVPTMKVDGQLWWGNDRLFLMEEFLSGADK